MGQGEPAADAVVRWPRLALLLPLLPLLVLVASTLSPRQRELLILDGDQPLLSRPFRLQDGWLGSPRLDLQAQLPPNSALALDVDLLDAAGKPVLQLTKEGWRERGTWQEDGESGTYDEQDADLTLALRPPASGDYRLRLLREDLQGAGGEPVNAPLRVWLSVNNHSVDRGLLLITALCGAVLARILWAAVYGDCRQRVRRRESEPRLGVRLDLGGPGLVRITVRARYEEPHHPPLGRGSPPAQVALDLSLSDAVGRPLLRATPQLRLRHVSGSDDEWWMLSHQEQLRLPEPCSVRIRVALPETLARGGLELEWLDLLVEDGVVIPWLQTATTLSPAQPL